MNNPGINYLWFSAAPLVLSVFVILAFIGCSATDQTVNRKENEILQANLKNPSDGSFIEFDFYQAVNSDLEDRVIEISRRLGLVPLAKVNRSEGFEFRLWTNLAGRGEPKLIGIRSTGHESDAYYFEMDRNAESIKSRREPLPKPTSGWSDMLYRLRNLLQIPKPLVRDPNFDLSRDEPVILLEVFDKGDYRRVFYGHSASFPDANRLIQACEYLGSEFSVAMDCRPSYNYETDWKNIYFRGINERLTGSGIPTLSERTLPFGNSEIRIWSGFSTLPLKGLILERKGDRSSAIYLRPRPDESSSACLRDLPEPKSGWDTFWKAIEAHGVASIEDSNDIGKIDEGGVVVEVLISDDYRAYKYSGVAKEKGGNYARLFNFSELIKEEFDVDLLWAPAPNGPEICRE